MERVLRDGVRLLCEKERLTVKNGVLCYKRRIKYCYGKDFVESFKRCYNKVCKMVRERSGVDLGKDGDDNAVQMFFRLCVERKVMLKVRKKEGDEMKYPYVLFPPVVSNNDDDVYKFEEKEYYWLNVVDEEGNMFNGIWVMMLLVVLIVVVGLVGCFVQIWSIKVKIVVIWMLIGFVFVLFVITFCNLFIAFIAFVCGYDVILLPNLMEMNMSVKERVCNPFIACYPRKDSFGMVVIRISIIIGIVIMCCVVYVYREDFNKIAVVVVERGMKVFKYVNNKLLMLFSNNGNKNRKDEGL